MGLYLDCILVQVTDKNAVTDDNLHLLLSPLAKSVANIAFDECWEIVEEDTTAIGVGFDTNVVCFCGQIVIMDFGDRLQHKLSKLHPEREILQMSVVQNTGYAAFTITKGGATVREWDSQLEVVRGEILPEEQDNLDQPVARVLSVASRILGCSFLRYDWEKMAFQIWKA